MIVALALIGVAALLWWARLAGPGGVVAGEVLPPETVQASASASASASAPAPAASPRPTSPSTSGSASRTDHAVTPASTVPTSGVAPRRAPQSLKPSPGAGGGTRRVVVRPVAGPPSWPDVVTALFDTRAAAFAQGRPSLLIAADAAGSPLLRADQSVFTRVIRGGGYQRVTGLQFRLSAFEPLSVHGPLARIAVTGRQQSCVLVGPAARLVVPAGPVRTVVVELRRLPDSADWRLEAAGPAI